MRVEVSGGGSNRELPTLWHRVPRIDDEVDDDLFELSPIGLHDGGGNLREDRELDGLSEQRAQHGKHIRYHSVHVQRRRLQYLPTAEGEELPRQERGAIRGLLDVLDAPAYGIVGWKLIEQECVAAENHHAQVVELVGDATGHVPDRLHLLGLHELGLRVREIVVGALDIL